MALQRHVLLRDFEGFSRSDRDLRPHDIYGGDLLSDCVFHLDARIHLNEVVAPLLVEQEFHRARVVIIHGSGDGDGGFAHLRAQTWRQDQRGRNLDQLLVASLDRAVAFAQVDHVSMTVGQDLELNMVWPFNVFFDEQGAVAESCQRFPRGGVHIGPQLHVGADDPEPTASASSACLDHHRVAGCSAERQRLVGPADRAVGSRHDRDPDLLRELPCLDFVTHQMNDLRGWPDEGDT